MTTLQPFLAFPLHPVHWARPTGNHDYRVTNTFAGPDLVNGGIHRAVDIGNFRTGDTIKSPAPCRARGMTHTDGAIGVQFDLGGGWLLELWHLSKHLLASTFQPVALGQAVGATGASGRVQGAHTHIELKRHGEKIDPEPYLPMPERPALAIPGATVGGRFSDVPPDHRWYSAIEWAAEQGLISGLPDGTYRPDAALTRGQLAVIMYRGRNR